MPGALRGQKMAVDAMEPELQTVIAVMWVLGLEPGFSRRAAHASNL